MKSFTIRLAGQYFTICPVCDYIREYCRDYIVADDTEDAMRFRIATTQSDIDFVLWSSIFVTFVAKKIIGLLLGYYRSLPCM